MVADREVSQYRALHADRSVHQEGGSRRAQAPIDRGELVDQVPCLFAEEPCHVDLIPTQEVEAHAR